MSKSLFTHQFRLGILFIGLLLLAVNTTHAQTDKENQTRQQIKLLDGKMKQLRAMLSGFKSERSDLQTSLQKAEVDIGKVQKNIRNIQQQLQQEQNELAKLQQKRKSLNSAKAEQQKFIGQQIVAAYQVGQQKKIKVLLNQEQPDKISRALTYYNYFNQARSEQIDNYIGIISEINTIEPRIIEKTNSLNQAKNQLSSAHTALLTSKKERENNLAKINSAIKNNDQRLSQMNKDRSELEKLLAAVEQTLANISIPSEYQPFHSLKGRLPWPVAGKPSNRFGRLRNGTNLQWQGISIPGNEGSIVKAIHHGRVVFADWLRGSGLLVIIDHGDGYMSLYAHNQSLLKETGDWVNPGDVIATVGNSGGQRQAGLYFEIRHQGKPTNPALWCKRG
ncbi:murein hydrolase activator EnvC [Oceanicoccus sp. KOV_DT_Chl]|uniref:murein hydrolase activator EnvC family protein n=1 Tax=Oceanicoccus sp. KOV_DT_Chl TaxID=1904639 RepID=UPI000C7CE76A|nr:peptidoglycan DD-metalloendopeptidase family protein [Oceanicoccus sp. KOV_DT_Chl]